MSERRDADAAEESDYDDGIFHATDLWDFRAFE
jgi:hypothetical protein